MHPWIKHLWAWLKVYNKLSEKNNNLWFYVTKPNKRVPFYSITAC